MPSWISRHFPIALRNGLTMQEVEEVIYHVAGYAGYAAAASARSVANSVPQSQRNDCTTAPITYRSPTHCVVQSGVPASPLSAETWLRTVDAVNTPRVSAGHFTSFRVVSRPEIHHFHQHPTNIRRLSSPHGGRVEELRWPTNRKPKSRS
jgi:hypothetical protein